MSQRENTESWLSEKHLRSWESSVWWLGHSECNFEAFGVNQDPFASIESSVESRGVPHEHIYGLLRMKSPPSFPKMVRGSYCQRWSRRSVCGVLWDGLWGVSDHKRTTKALCVLVAVITGYHFVKIKKCVCYSTLERSFYSPCVAGANLCKASDFKQYKNSSSWWCTSVIPTVWEAEAGGS